MKTVLHEELSHGLRTPLTSVLGYAGTLLEQWEHMDDDARVEFVRIVYGEALRMAQWLSVYLPLVFTAAIGGAVVLVYGVVVLGPVFSLFKVMGQP